MFGSLSFGTRGSLARLPVTVSLLSLRSDGGTIQSNDVTNLFSPLPCTPAKMRREKGGPGAGGPSFAGPGGAGGRPKPNLTPEKLARIADDPVAWRQFLMEQGVEQDKIPSVEEIKRARAEERAKREREGNGGRDEL